MATLATVIGRGLAASKPASPAEGYVYFSTDTGRIERYSGSAWETIDAPGLVFKFSTTTADADPGAGTIRFDNGTPASVTTVRVDDTTLISGADMGTVWENVTGARLLIQDPTDSAKYLLVEVTAAADGTGYWNLTVTVDDSGTLPADGALLVVYVLGGGGGAATAETLGDILWFRSPLVDKICEAYFDNGAYSAWGHNQVLSLYSGTTDVAGSTGSGGYTEASVSCNLWYDLTPINGNFNGYVMSYVHNNAHPPASEGIYGMAHARWPVDDDNDLVVGFSRFRCETDSTLYAFVGFVKRAGQANFEIATCIEGDSWYYTDTGVAWNGSVWHVFEICYMDVGATRTLYAWIDGVLVGTITANLPTATDATFIPNFYVGGCWASADVTTYDAYGFVSKAAYYAYYDGEGYSIAKSFS